MGPADTDHSLGLGAQARDGLRLIAFGLAIGLVSAYFVVQQLRDNLEQISAHDPLSFTLLPLLLLAVGLTACYFPARSAMQLDLVPFLKNVEFDSSRVPRRWWPKGKRRQVALDPRRSFGQPIIFREGIPTQVLARSFRANKSVEEVARWFEINSASVREAVEFEQERAA